MWSLPSRSGSAGRRSVHIQWMREGCREWWLKGPLLKEVFQAGAALQGRGTDKNGPSPTMHSGPWPDPPPCQ